MTTPFDQYGKVVAMPVDDFAEESLWDISFVVPEDVANTLKSKYHQEALIDLGGGTKILTYETVLKDGKTEFVKKLADLPAETIDELWQGILQAAKEESSLFP